MRFLKILLFFFFIQIFLFQPVRAIEETEPNNIKEEACFISSGETITGHTGVKTEQGLTGDIDIFGLNIKSPGKLTLYCGIVKKFGSSDGNPSIRIDIINSEDLNAGQWKNPYTGKNSSPVFETLETDARSINIQKAGTIYIKVDRYEADSYYKLTVVYSGEGLLDLPVPDPVQEEEPNDIPSEANLLPIRQPVTGHTGNTGKYGLEGNRDYFMVEVPSPGKLTVFLTVQGKYSDTEKGDASVKITFINSDEMASGEWKDIETGLDKSPVFYKGTDGFCIFIKQPGDVLLSLDRYEANAKYKMIVLFQTGE